MNACKPKSHYENNLTLIKEAQAGDGEALSLLCEQNSGLVRSVASRFLGRGAEYEDLVQIGSIGMIRAVRSFDAERGCVFSTYAVPLIMGEIRRFLRDDGLIKVGREQKRIGALILREKEKRMAEGAGEVGICELAEAVGVSCEDAVLALEAASPVTMLSDPVFDDEGCTLSETLSDSDECERIFDRIALSEAVGKLPPLWRQIVVCRYFRDMSQQKTAEALSLSQVKISREEKKLLAFLRSQME